MTWLTGIYIILSISVALNIFGIWYCVRLLRELLEVSATLEDLFVDVAAFSQHLEKVYELEMFYGDQTLENLLSHARTLTKEFEQYEVLFSLREAPEPEEEDFDDNSDKA